MWGFFCFDKGGTFIKHNTRFYFDPFLAGFLEREDFYACKIDDDTEKCYLWIFLL